MRAARGVEVSLADGPDSRRYERFKILDYALIVCKKRKEPLRSVVVDIGLGGLQLRSKEPLPVGEPCLVQIGRDGVEPLSLQGEVRYSRTADETGLYSSGFKFLPRTHAERTLIAEYVHSVFLRQGEQLANADEYLATG